MRVSSRKKLSKFDIRLAEDLVKLPRLGYSDLLQLESDISQISELVLLFTESAGSFTELGVFALDIEISPRLMVVIDGHNYNEDSFIRKGVLEYLESTLGEEIVCVIDLIDHGAERIDRVKNLNIDSFELFIEEKISQRLNRKSEPSTFEKSRPGHLIKLMTGLIQNYAALTLDEIDLILFCIGISEPHDKLKRLLGCAELFGWITAQKSGTRTFYSSTGGKIAVNFEMAGGSIPINRSKWRMEIRQYWKEKDPDRFKCISAAASLGSSK